MRHVHLVPSYCAEFGSMLCFKGVVLEVILVFMAKNIYFHVLFLSKSKFLRSQQEGVIYARAPSVPPSLKWVFSRNPTETGYADEEIFTCIGSLPASLQPVLAQVCSYP